jgi:hypothetical protein
MAAKKHTHIAVHTLQTQDKVNGTVEVKAGSGYTPANEDEEKALLKSGAIRKALKADLERLDATEVTKDRSADDAPTGYSPGTSSAADEPGLKGDENKPLDDPQATDASNPRTPVSGTRGTGGTRGNA